VKGYRDLEGLKQAEQRSKVPVSLSLMDDGNATTDKVESDTYVERNNASSLARLTPPPEKAKLMLRTPIRSRDLVLIRFARIMDQVPC
jgi:hypothetical protein